VTYFLDNTFPRKLADILRLLDVDVVHLQAEFDPGTADEVWIPQVSAKGYILLTGDGRIRKGSVERAALEESQLPAIFLYSGYTNLSIWEQVAFLVRHWPAIDKEARRLKPGETRLMGVNGSIVTYEERAAKRKKK
jgi:hypothetical protein